MKENIPMLKQSTIKTHKVEKDLQDFPPGTGLHKSDVKKSKIEQQLEVAKELYDALKNGVYDMIEWRDECTREIESFEGNEKQMMVDITEDVKQRLKAARAALTKYEQLNQK